MELIIAEKAIAGKRIASILAGKEIAASAERGAQFFPFGEGKLLVPLRGHVKDVEFPKQYSYWIGTDLQKLVFAPIEYIETEKGILAFLKIVAPKVEKVIVATDSDREGESIGLEAVNTIKAENSNVEIKRAYFSAITEKDIKSAFSSLKELDYNFADSADARREIDLIWGAVLTRFLSIVSGRLGKEFLSIGRVQGPCLALIVNREKERLAFVSQPYWELIAEFEKDKNVFAAEHKNGRFWNREGAEKAMLCSIPKIGKVKSVSKKERILSKPIPFNTTEFLRAAIAIGFSAGKAMEIAESLYQSGYTSYPRTDNTVYPKTLDLNEILLELAKVPDFREIVEKILSQKEMVPSAGKETKDHPPVHPVAFADRKRLSAQHWKIYELICRRFFATLFEDAITENVSVEIDLNNELFIARGRVFMKKGWKEFYPYSQTLEVLLPKLEKNDVVQLNNLKMLGKETQPPARYSQGTLIKLMDELGLGTKATRHEIIQKLFARKYISGLNTIVPNRIAFAVIDALEKHASSIVKPKMTAELEKEMDLVAAGKKPKSDVVQASRDFLGEILAELLRNKDDIGRVLRNALRADTIIGKCTKAECEGELLIRRGKTGKRFVGCSAYPKCTNSFPLPQKGIIAIAGKFCPECSEHVIAVKGARYSFEMCLKVGCLTKKDWGAKKEKEAKAVEGKDKIPQKQEVKK